MKELLSKPIGGKSGSSVKASKGKYPDKTTINLLVQDAAIGDPKKRIAVLIVIILLAAVVLKFLVFDRIWNAYETQREYTELKTLTSELQIINKDYEKVRAEYSHYGNSYANQEEAAEIDRSVIMSVITSDILSKADIQSIQVAGNSVMVSIDNIRLGTVSSIVDLLESESSVSFVNVSTAGTNTTEANSSVQATLNINFVSEGGNN